jgi:ferredoxin-NADP reductase
MSTTALQADLELLVAQKQPIADGIIRLTLRHAAGRRLPEWAPGAHVDLVLGNGDASLIRQYSLCGDMAAAASYEVAILREPNGRGGSSYAHDVLHEGMTVRVRGPRNHFALVPAQRYVFIAGGIGITPIVPMIAAVAGQGLPWRLLYGGRTRTSMAFRELAARYPGQVRICPQDEYGLLDVASFLGKPDTATAVYCCGPEALLLAVEQMCQSWPRGALHVERFTPVPGAAHGPRTSFEVQLARSSVTLPVPPDRSILEVIQGAGITVEFSCQEGTCGTCETAVLDGVPDHRDSLLTDDERAANDTMMICVSRSSSPCLVLDL